MCGPARPLHSVCSRAWCTHTPPLQSAGHPASVSCSRCSLAHRRLAVEPARSPTEQHNYIKYSVHLYTEINNDTYKKHFAYTSLKKLYTYGEFCAYCHFKYDSYLLFRCNKSIYYKNFLCHKIYFCLLVCAPNKCCWIKKNMNYSIKNKKIKLKTFYLIWWTQVNKNKPSRHTMSMCLGSLILMKISPLDLPCHIVWVHIGHTDSAPHLH